MTPTTPIVAILAGGLGSRLREVAPGIPKPLVELGGRPYLAWQLEHLAAFGLLDIVLCVGHMADEFPMQLGHGSRFGVRIRYSCEETPLGTGGALRLALPLFGDRTVLVQNGDTYCELNLTDLIARHRSARARLTMAAVSVEDTGRYGRVEHGPQGWVTALVEKASAGGRGLVNAGTYVIEPRVIANIPPGVPNSLERDLFPTLCGQGFLAVPTALPLLDIGTPETYRQAQAFFAARVRTSP